MEDFILQYDTREQKNSDVIEYFTKKGIEVVREKLDVGDYINKYNSKLSVDKKFSLQEIAVDYTSQLPRIEREFAKAQEQGIKLVVLIDNCNFSSINSVKFWNSTYYRYNAKEKSKQMKGNVLMNMMKDHHEKYEVIFMFCKKGDAGKYIYEILSGKREPIQK